MQPKLRITALQLPFRESPPFGLRCHRANCTQVENLCSCYQHVFCCSQYLPLQTQALLSWKHMSKSSILFWRGVHCFIIKRTSKAPHKIETLTARLFNGCEGLQSAVCFGLRKPSDNEHMLFPLAGVLMVCHVNVCALFKVIDPLPPSAPNLPASSVQLKVQQMTLRKLQHCLSPLGSRERQ